MNNFFLPRLSAWRPRKRRALSALLLVLSLASCEKEEATVKPAAIDATADATLQRLLQMGFKREHIEDNGSFYLVEGDIRFDKQAVNPALPTRPGTIVGQQEQASVNSLIDVAQQPGIAVRIDGSFPAQWRGDVEQAIKDWNEIAGSRINLYMSDGSLADITVRGEDLQRGLYGFAAWPSNGKPGFQVVINRTDAPDFRRRTTIVHEIGHCLGFRHTNLYSNGEGAAEPLGGNVISGTPREDPNSVMNSGSAPNRQLPWQGFSQFDNLGLQNLYPESIANERVYDADYYLRIHSDLTQALGATNFAGAWQHWSQYGVREGRTASFVFDPVFYRSTNPDLAGVTNQQLVEHWLNYGLNEGRAGSIFFDPRYYLQQNNDLQQAFGNQGFQKAVNHFLANGITEGRVASPRFNVRNYLNRYADLRNGFGTNYREAMIHWMNSGRYENRNPL
jgi:hypothetical protein